jgi:hypothetical protein
MNSNAFAPLHLSVLGGPKGLIKHTRTLIRFNKACRETMRLVENLNKEVLNLQARYIEQRFLIVLCSYQQWQGTELKKGSPGEELRKAWRWHHKLETDNDMLAHQLSQKLGRPIAKDTPDGLNGWMTGTVFKPAFAALASRVELDGDYQSNALSCAGVWEWLEVCAPFLPSMILYNSSETIIGETHGRWGDWPLLEQWSKDLRDRTFPKDVREQYVEAQQPLQRVLQAAAQKPWMSKSELIDEGCKAMATEKPALQRNFFRRYVQDDVWMAVSPRLLEPRDLSLTCRVWFKDVRLIEPSVPEPWRCLSEKWGDIEGHQFAEADAHRQKMGKRSGSSAPE